MLGYSAIVMLLEVSLVGVINLDGPIRITPIDGCIDGASVWVKGGEALIHVKRCGRDTFCAVEMIDLSTWERKELATSRKGIYSNFYPSPDGKYILAYWVSKERCGPADWVVINIETGEIKRYPCIRGNMAVYPDSILFWDLSKGHELKLMGDREWERVVSDSLLREQRHHWPDWVKQLIKEGAKRVVEYREQKKMGVKEIKLTKSPVVPGHFFVKVLERDEKGYVKRAQLWAYPEGKEPYLAMDEDIYGIIRCFSPDHRYMVIQGKDNHLYIARADGSDVTRVTEKAGKDYVYAVILWGSDSKKFIYGMYSKKYPEVSGIYLVRIEE